MLENTPVTRYTDPRVKRTRALIEQAFHDLLEEKSFQSISVQDITDRAEINRSTFYAHYKDKYALLESSITRIFRRELEQQTLSACHYSRENLQALIVTVCDFIALAHQQYKPADSQFEVLVEKQVKKEVQALLEHWLEESGPTNNAKMAATAATWAIYGLALQWNNDKNHGKVEQFARQISPHIMGILQITQ